MRILNTRPQTQAHELSKAIHEACGVSIELPTLTIQATHQWLETTPSLNTIDQAIFVSKHAIIFFFEALKHTQRTWPFNIPITLLGQGSAHVLHQYHLTAPFLPAVADSEHVLAMPHLQSLDKQSILIIKGSGGRPLLENTLKQRGGNIHTVVVYERQLPKIKQTTLTAIWQKDAVDIILFTSQQAMENLFQLLGPKAHQWIQQKPCLVISPRLAEVAASLGIQTIITSTYEKLLNALEGFKHDTR